MSTPKESNSKYQAGKIIPDKDSEQVETKKEQYCCMHKNLVPLEFGLATKTYPQGYKNDPYYNFAINLISANVIRVRTYLCLDCKMEVKAPDPGQLKKDRL